MNLLHIFLAIFGLSMVTYVVAMAAKPDYPIGSQITIPISVYILDDQDGNLSSSRSTEDLILIFDKASEIWAQAGIKFEIKYVGRINVPSKILKPLTDGNPKPFLKGINKDFKVSNPSMLNAYYVSSIGLVNGIAVREDMFLVADNPTVKDERVTAHEIGHLFGLGHDLSDTSKLMYSGTNGTVLTPEEIKTARINAQRKLDTTYRQDLMR